MRPQGNAVAKREARVEAISLARKAGRKTIDALCADCRQVTVRIPIDQAERNLDTGFVCNACDRPGRFA